MDMLWHRRSALFCLAFVYVGFVSVFLSVNIRLTAIFSAVILFAVSLLPPIRRLFQAHFPTNLPAILRLILCAAALSLAFYTVHQHISVDLPTKRLESTETQVTAVIQNPVYTAAYGAYIAAITTEDGNTCRVLLQIPNTGLTTGDTVSCTASFSPLQEYSGSFPERRYYYSLRTVLRAEADDVLYLGHTSMGWLRDLFYDWQKSLAGILRADLGREDSALAIALFLGDRSDLADTLTRDFRRLGISHLLAISGMHFTMLLSGLDAILRLFLPNKKRRTVILATADVGYMFLCGLSPSVVRAGLMMLIVYAALFLSRRNDAPTSLGIAAFLMCVADPTSVYSVALQLSVTSVLALCVFSHIINTLSAKKPSSERKHWLRTAVLALLLPAAVQMALLPLLCLYFGEISLITPVSTILVSPLIQLILLLTPIYLLLRAAAPLAILIGGAIGGLSWITAEIATAFASIRGITVSLVYPFVPVYALALSGLFMTAPLCRERMSLRRHLAGILGICVLFALSLFITKVCTANQVKIISVSKGKNDAVIVMTAGDTLLMDVSDGAYSTLSETYAAAAKNGAVEIEGLYLSHLHTQHIQSVRRLCDTVYVRSILLPAPETETETDVYLALCSLAEAQNIPIYTYGATDHLAWGGNVEILPEARTYLPRSVHPIIAFTVRANDASFTYLGAAASEISAFTNQTDAEILVFGGHGPLYKTEITVDIPTDLQFAVCRGDSASFLSDSLRDALRQAVVYADSEPVICILTP